MSFVVFKVVGVLVLLCKGCYLTTLNVLNWVLNKKYIMTMSIHIYMNNNMIKIDFYIPRIMNEKITKIAKLMEANRSEVIRNALRDYLDKKLLEIGKKE